MRKITRLALTATAVTATAVALTATPASAATLTVTVSPGGAVTGTNSGPVAGLNKNTGAVLVCQSSTATGTAPGGTVSGTAPVTVGTLSTVTFSTPGATNNWCVANNSIPTRVTALNLPWSLGVTGVTASGKTPGLLSGVKVELYAPSIGCTSVVGGPGTGGSGGIINGQHANPLSAGAPSKLSLPAGATNNLKVLSTTGTCPTSLINVGDTVNLSGTYNLNPGQTVTATSP